MYYTMYSLMSLSCCPAGPVYIVLNFHTKGRGFDSHPVASFSFLFTFTFVFTHAYSQTSRGCLV